MKIIFITKINRYKAIDYYYYSFDKILKNKKCTANLGLPKLRTFLSHFWFKYFEKDTNSLPFFSLAISQVCVSGWIETIQSKSYIKGNKKKKSKQNLAREVRINCNQSAGKNLDWSRSKNKL